MITIKALADQLGVPKQRVYRYVKNHITDVHLEANVMYLDDEQVKQVSSAFTESSASDDPHHDVVLDVDHDVVLDLRNQLKEKDGQIAELLGIVRDAQKNLQAAQALHAADCKDDFFATSFGAAPEDVSEAHAKPSRWQRLRAAWRG